jgi:uncharacterized protein YaiE (UPF0345 family)
MGGTMLKSNEYFDGKVKSIGFSHAGQNATVGVMDIGDYEFSTGAPELMVVIDGALSVQVPGSMGWQEFPAGTSFKVPGNAKFQLKVSQPTAYLCRFIG